MAPCKLTRNDTNSLKIRLGGRTEGITIYRSPIVIKVYSYRKSKSKVGVRFVKVWGQQR